MRFARVLPFLLLSAALFAAVAGDWRDNISSKDRARVNPYVGEQDAVLAGGKLYLHHCASCHGKQLEGSGAKPALNTERVRNLSSGELQWLLTNGSMKKGMPSWSRLPEQQRWQIVTFLQSQDADIASKK
jgi:mono/diheme cytochrome c family protein